MSVLPTCKPVQNLCSIPVETRRELELTLREGCKPPCGAGLEPRSSGRETSTVNGWDSSLASTFGIKKQTLDFSFIKGKIVMFTQGKRRKASWVVVTHAFNPSVWDAEAAGSL